VTVWLPEVETAAESKPPDAAPAAAAAPPAAGAGANRRWVLVVDDDRMVLEVAQAALERAGWSVAITDNGTDALKEFESRPGAIAVVVSDISMPGMDGLELVARLRHIQGDLPVQFISGGTQELAEDYLRGLPGPKPLFLKKPFAVQAFLENVNRLARLA
jgi:two-component system cell cycle sensor histidine kinase/response regulator CckA